ncbi:putative DNA-binding response regulator [Paenibacillus agaridevorans]|uniref:Putative DNA-binding response regulator n=1 Tax=Paenibacillus agaridevorans TaxID=171404 RepID=A0A2R5EIQ2_9BACL|nr:helix-turn-helix domain-containing protein [Paenibacillus agaridevorans]GBG06486.1 putative DNA-binding response regulator [Paenibacillus agaridevorans]
MRFRFRDYDSRIVIILLLVAIPPFLIASIYQINIYLKQTITLVDAKNESELIRTGTFMNQMLEQVRDGVLEGMKNEQFMKTQRTGDKLQVLKSLNKAVNSSKYLEQVMYYNEAEDYMLVSNYGIVSDVHSSPYNWVTAEAAEMENYQIKVMEARSLDIHGSHKYVSSLLAKLPTGTSQSYLNYTINLEKLYNDFLQKLNVDGGVYNYYLTDLEGKIVYHQDLSLLGVHMQNNPAASSLNNKIVISSYPIQAMKWNLVSEVNMYQLSSGIYKTRDQMIVFLTIMVVVILAMAVLGAKQLYMPISQLKLRLHNSEHLLKKTLVHNLVKERFTESSDIERYLDEYPANLIIVILTIHSQIDRTTDDSGLAEEIETCLRAHFNIDLFVESDKQYVVLLKLHDDDRDTFTNNLTLSFNDRLLEELTISVGGIYPIKKIHHSYIEALYAYNMGRIYSSDTNVYSYSQLPADFRQQQIKDPTMDELELAIRQHNVQTYTEIIDMMLSENRSVMEYNYNLYQYITLLIRLYDQESVRFLSEINELITDKGIMNAAAVKQFFISKFSNFNTEYRQDFNDYVARVEQYIAEFYATNFSMDDVADYVGVNRKYLSQLFKKQYNMTLTDYVSQYRIEQAKLLLADTKMKINDIGSNVGFNSKSYFTKVFKMLTGITPTEYRELAWNRNKEGGDES